MNDNEIIKKLNKTLTDMSLDIRHILTTLNHIEEKYQDTQKYIDNIRKTARDNHKQVRELVIEVNTLNSEKKEMKQNVKVLFNKLRSRDQKSDNDRKWLIGTVISVVVMFVGIVSLFIFYVSMLN